MDRELDALGMLDLMVCPGFCVKDHTIVKCNPGAESLLFSPGMDIIPMLATGETEYAEFSGGCLYLTLAVNGAPWGASVTRVGDWDVFLLEESADRSELQAMALAARELREPLAGIMITAERMFPMSAMENNPALQEQAARLNRGLYQMLRILGNMSDAGSYSEEHTPSLTTMDVQALFREIFEKVQALVSHTGIGLEFENLPSSLYCLVHPEKLERAVMNIISNALKFTPSGGTIQARLTRQGSRLTLRICDSGEGIPDAIRGSVHSRFRRTPGIEDSRFGIGLGMVLIRSAAAIHGGTVLIDHPEGAGTRITMTLKIRQNTGGAFRSAPRLPDYAGELDHGLIELSEVLPHGLYGTEKIK